MRIRTIAKEYDGRWMIVSAIALAMLLFGTRAHAQIVSSNPLEYVALAVEKARGIDPFGHAGFDPSGKIRLTL